MKLTDFEKGVHLVVVKYDKIGCDNFPNNFIESRFMSFAVLKCCGKPQATLIETGVGVVYMIVIAVQVYDCM